MSLFAVDCEGSDSGEAPIPLILNKRNIVDHKITNSPRKTRKTNSRVKTTEPKENKVIECKRVEIEPENESKNDNFEIIDNFNQNEKSESEKEPVIQDTIEKEERVTPKSNDSLKNEEKINQKITEKHVNSQENPVKNDEDAIKEQNKPEIPEDNENERKPKKQQKEEEEYSYTYEEEEEEEDKGEFQTYTIQKDVVKHFVGKSTFFRLVFNGKTLYTAKYKKGNDVIPIMEGEDAHMSGKPDYVIIRDDSECDFSLKEKSQTGLELFSIRYYAHFGDGTRSIVLTFIKPINGIPVKVYSIDYTTERKYNNFKIKSIKNAVFRPTRKKLPVIFIRKIEKNQIEISTKYELEAAYVMALGVSTFVCKLSGN